MPSDRPPDHPAPTTDDHCWRCAGDKLLWGYEINEADPDGWQDRPDDGLYTCDCCGGTGRAGDCTYR